MSHGISACTPDDRRENWRITSRAQCFVHWCIEGTENFHENVAGFEDYTKQQANNLLTERSRVIGHELDEQYLLPRRFFWINVNSAYSPKTAPWFILIFILFHLKILTAKVLRNGTPRSPIFGQCP